MKKLYRWWPSVRGDSARPNSPNIHGIRLHHVTGISHLQIGIEMIWMSMWNRKYSPSHLANAPVWFGLVPMPCYALRHASLCLKEACRPSQSHKDRVKKLLQLQPETQRETTGAICVKCLSRSSPRPQPSSSSRSARFPTAKGKKSTKVEPEKSFGPKKSVSCKLQVDVKIRRINVFTSWLVSSMSPYMSLFMMSIREHRNLELPGPSLRRNLGKCMSFMNV